ncbi:MAG: hypothetical protein HY658_00970, partial [Actinobacteria bacterium]|nr:hypothetical protein [Actinomycetota bacterium]
LREEGVLATMVAGRVRMLTHVGVSSGDVDEAVAAWRRVAQSRRGAGSPGPRPSEGEPS